MKFEVFDLLYKFLKGFFYISRLTFFGGNYVIVLLEKDLEEMKKLLKNAEIHELD